jgi:hypothetical protein
MPAVYALVAKSDSTNIRYVGRTKHETPDKRYKRHIKNALGGSSEHVYSWIRKVLAEGDEVLVFCLESGLSYYQSGQREKHYIAHYRSLGFDLTNKTDGGEGTLGWVPSLETRSKMGVHRRGVAHTDEVKAEISRSAKGRVFTEEHKNKLRAASLGQVHSADSREKVRAANLGRVHSEASKANMKAAQMARRARVS